MKCKKLIEVIEKPQSGEWGKDDATGNGIPVLRTTNFTDVGEVDFSNVVTRDIDPNKIEKKALRNGDIIIEKSGGSDTKPVGRVIYFDGEDGKYLFNNFTSVLRVKNGIDIKNKYLFYYLLHFYRKMGTVRYENKTTGLHNLKLDQMVNDVLVPFISKEEQEKVCDILDRVYRCIKLRKEELICYDNLIKSRFIEMFGDAVDNPLGWEKKRLREIVTDDCTISYGIVQTGDNQLKGVPVFRPVDIVNRVPVLEELKKTTKEISDKYKKTILKGREMLITVRANIADTCIVGKEFKGCNVGRGIVPIRTKEDVMILEFLKFQIDSKHLNDNIKSMAKGITLIQLNMEDLREVELIIPTLAQQKAFVVFAKQVDKLKFEVQQSLDETQILFDSLMQKYFG